MISISIGWIEEKHQDVLVGIASVDRELEDVQEKLSRVRSHLSQHFFWCNGGNARRDFENGYTSAVQVILSLCRKESLNIVGMQVSLGQIGSTFFSSLSSKRLTRANNCPFSAASIFLNLHFLQRPDFMLYSLVFGIKNLINKLWQQNSSAVVLPQECLRCEHYVATASYFSWIFLCVGTLLVEAKMLAAASSEDLNACIN